MSNTLVGRFEHLPNRPKSDDALPLLEKIASQVKPIMSKRGWKVGTLAEFLPANPALLGNNMAAGQRINLRLRPPGNTSTFYEYDQLLTHIEHGPHDAKFYKLLGELEEEYYDLKRKGYSGEGFHGNGNPLTGFKVPQYVGKAKGLAAAEQRLATQRKIGKGGVLGGSAVTAGKSMKEVVAEAAERRIRDDKACNTADAGHAREVEEEVRKAQAESEGVDAVDLRPAPVSKPPSVVDWDEQPPPLSTNVAEPSTSTPTPKPRSRPPLAAPSNLREATTLSQPNGSGPSNRPLPRAKASEVIDLTGDDNDHNDNDTDEWPCPTCTLLNPFTALSCEACTTPRPQSQSQHRPKTQDGGWFCDFCGSGPREMSFWSCNECGWVRKWG